MKVSTKELRETPWLFYAKVGKESVMQTRLPRVSMVMAPPCTLAISWHKLSPNP
jgi:hypothetical protein